MTSEDQKRSIQTLYKIVLDRIPDDDNIREIQAQIDAGTLDYQRLLLSLTSSAEYLDRICARATDNYLLLVHNTRIKMMKFLLPRADVILDIGGANGSLIENGYSHPYSKLYVTDLPPDARDRQWRSIDLEKKWEGMNRVEVIFTSMTDMSMLPDQSVDLVWAGQVIEHVTQEDLEASLQETRRVLKPDGSFCFDTVNGIMARIQSPERMLNPDHKKEYTPQQIRHLVEPFFSIQEEYGLVPMHDSFRTGRFQAEEAIINNTFSQDLDQSYLIYFHCRPRA